MVGAEVGGLGQGRVGLRGRGPAEVFEDVGEAGEVHVDVGCGGVFGLKGEGLWLERRRGGEERRGWYAEVIFVNGLPW